MTKRDRATIQVEINNFFKMEEMQNFEALTKGQIILTQEEVFKNDLTNEVDEGSLRRKENT